MSHFKISLKCYLETKINAEKFSLYIENWSACWAFWQIKRNWKIKRKKHIFLILYYWYFEMFNHICHTYFIFVLFICFLNQLLKNVIYKQFCFFSGGKKSHCFSRSLKTSYAHTHHFYLFIYFVKSCITVWNLSFCTITTPFLNKRSLE